MILPQSDAFLLLKQRLDCVPNYYNKIAQTIIPNTDINTSNNSNDIIEFKQLLQHFIQVQEKHKFFKKTKRVSINSINQK